MGRRMHTDIRVRGMVFPTVQAACARLRVTEGAVLYAIRNGSLDTLGLGRGCRKAKRVTIRGVRYRSAATAALALGVGKSAIYNALKRGTLERVGLPPDQRPRRDSTPVIVRDRLYPSARAAAEDLGLTVSAIWRAIDENRAHRVGLKPDRSGPRPRPFVLFGHTFASRRAAAERLGFSYRWFCDLVRRRDRATRERLLAALMAAEAQPKRRAA